MKFRWISTLGLLVMLSGCAEGVPSPPVAESGAMQDAGTFWTPSATNPNESDPSGGDVSPTSPNETPSATPAPAARTYASGDVFPIPDGYPLGVTSTINVPDSVVVDSVEVALLILHPRVSDLEVRLEHNGVAYPLWSRDHADTEDINHLFTVGVDELAAQGEWTLVIADHVFLPESDEEGFLAEGELLQWELTFPD